MNKRQRKKWLKQHNRYVNEKEVWNLDCTISEWIVPRLKKFKKINGAYPGIAPMDTYEKWNIALDKMIRGFELAKYEPIDLDENLNVVDDYGEFNLEKHKKIAEIWKKEVDEGLNLFATWYSYLWY